MKDKRVCVRFQDPIVWDSFLEYVECKYGKIHGMVGKELENVLKLFLNQPLFFEKIEQEQNCLEKFQDLKYKTTEIERDRLKFLHIISSQKTFIKKGDLSQTRFINWTEELKRLEKEIDDLNIQIIKIQKTIDWLIEYQN